jgi:hypothetical protein
MFNDDMMLHCENVPAAAFPNGGYAIMSDFEML